MCTCAKMVTNKLEIVSIPNSSTPRLVSKKVPVWQYFRFTASKELGKPVCRICYKHMPTKNSNMSNYLKYTHPSEYMEVNPATATTTTMQSSTSSEGSC